MDKHPCGAWSAANMGPCMAPGVIAFAGETRWRCLEHIKLAPGWRLVEPTVGAGAAPRLDPTVYGTDDEGTGR